MQLIVHMPGATPASAQRIAGEIAACYGVRVEVVSVTPKTATATLQARLQSTSCFVLADVLGIQVAHVNVMEASMALTLLECDGLFSSLAALKKCLSVWPCWAGQGARARSAYASLRGKLAPRGYKLVSERTGGYGFLVRPDLAVYLKG